MVPLPFLILEPALRPACRRLALLLVRDRSLPPEDADQPDPVGWLSVKDSVSELRCCEEVSEPLLLRTRSDADEGEDRLPSVLPTLAQSL